MLPGGIVYTDELTPAMQWLDDHTFIDERVRQVIAFRLANPKIYTDPNLLDFDYVKAQITISNCQRLGFNGQFCYEYFPRVPQAAPAPRTCDIDGEVLVPKYCPTCAGRRITGYECPKCRKEYPK